MQVNSIPISDSVPLSSSQASVATQISEGDLRVTINKLYDQLAETLLQGIVNQSISSELSQEISQMILQKLDTVKSREELLEFLHNLSTKWSAYNPFYIKLKYEEEKQRDDEKLKDVQEKLQQFMKNTYGSRNP